MKLEFRNNRDFGAGMMLFITGLVAVLIAVNYRFGSMLRMGPGFFPTVLGTILILFGLYIMAKGLRHKEKIEGKWSLRALILLPLSLVLFGVLMEHAGFIPALAIMVFVSAIAGRGFKWKEVLVLIVVLTVFTWAVFIWGLGLPYPLFKLF